ncbi:reticulocalbin-2-like [Convolutriloba macropyga]|uniref:reticulocalbin-2-like n=1 Tax=Convolutriloba macropyga TaxID=536237 RepID=UPI003F526AE1
MNRNPQNSGPKIMRASLSLSYLVFYIFTAMMALNPTLISAENDDASDEEESRRLERMYLKLSIAKIDTDGDEQITLEELTEWMKVDYNRSYTIQIEQEFKKADQDSDGFLSWSEHFNSSFATNENGELDTTKYRESEIKRVQATLANEKRRFEFACELLSSCSEETGMKLDLLTFKMFALPDYFPEMHPIMVEMSLVDLDENGDGVLFVDEYVNAITKSNKRRANSRRPNEEEGDDDSWMDSVSEEDIRRDYEYFFSHRDENKDGIMDYDEIKKWILPDSDGLVPGHREAKHLFAKVDKNSDQFLNFDEIEANTDLFLHNAFPSWFLQVYDKQAEKETSQSDQKENMEEDESELEETHADEDELIDEEILDQSEYDGPEHIEL